MTDHTTVDAGGQDHTALPVTAPGNPMTGPFFVEGAAAGDRLEVTQKLEKWRSKDGGLYVDDWFPEQRYRRRTDP